MARVFSLDFVVTPRSEQIICSDRLFVPGPLPVIHDCYRIDHMHAINNHSFFLVSQESNK